MADKLDTYTVLLEALDGSFRDRALLVDKLTSAAVEAFEAARAVGMDGAEGVRLCHMGHAVEAMMFADHYDAACVWFGKRGPGRAE